MNDNEFELEMQIKMTSVLLFFKDFFLSLKRLKKEKNEANLDEYYAALGLSSVIWLDLSKDLAEEYLVQPELTEYIKIIDDIKNEIGDDINYDYYHGLIDLTVNQMKKGVKKFGYEEF